MHKVEYPSAVTSTTHRSLPVPANAPEFVKKLTGEIIADRGNELPVSAFEPVVDGTWPTGTTQYEKRCIATEIPVWDPDTCIQCGKCSLVCPHGVIRMKVATEEELKNAPKGFKSAPYKGKEFAGKQFIWQMSPEDCTGCGICVSACPAKTKPIRNARLSIWIILKTIWKNRLPAGISLKLCRTSNVPKLLRTCPKQRS